MTRTEQYCTLRCALHNASSFYATLAQAGLVAGPSDLVKLFEAFPALISDYGPESHFYARMFTPIP
jgi:hypothetical protein